MGLRLRPDAAKDSVSLREFDWREKNTENLAALGRTGEAAQMRPDAAKDSASSREFDGREKNTENLAA
ncbi:MAG: hypothetical protein DDG58_10920, partial [Ardenticatenia bacterium]